MSQYRCQLERIGAPYWACGVGGLVLAAIVVLGTIYVSVGLWNQPQRPTWLLALLLALGFLGVSLAVRSALRVLSSRTGSEGNS